MDNTITIKAASLVATSMACAEQWHASEIVAPLALNRSLARTTVLDLAVPPGGPYRVDAGAAVESLWSSPWRQALRLRIGSDAWHEFLINAGEVAAQTVHAVFPASSKHRTISLTIEWALAPQEIVEILARALGFWRERWQAVNVDDAPELTVRATAGGYTIQPRSYGAPVDVDAQALAVLLLGRGLRVDLGECHSCVARSGKRDGRRVLARWEWGIVKGERGSLPALRARREGWSTARLTRIVVKSRPCPACTIDGKPTGREFLSWADAIIGSQSKDTRDAVTVYADKMQDDGDELGTLVAAWLRGPDVFGQHVAVVQRLAAEAVSARGS